MNRIVVIVFAVLFFSESVARAQTVLLRGTILDPSGAVIPEADVKVSRDGRIAGQRKSDSTGNFSFDLPAGDYRLQVSAPDFRAYFESITRQSEKILSSAAGFVDLFRLPPRKRLINSLEEETVTSIWSLNLVLALSVADASFTDARHSSQHAKPVLTVLVRDSVGIDPRIRKIARDHAIRILDHAGIELRWIDADGSEDPHLTSTSYLTVVIGDQPLTGSTTQDAMGFASAGTGPYRRAYVFSASITAFLQSFRIQGESSYGILLGHVIVHELGHLLISGNAHGNGIMHPRWAYPEWQQAAKGTLLFFPGHARAIREALQSK